jgi:hypothetical protein
VTAGHQVMLRQLTNMLKRTRGRKAAIHQEQKLRLQPAMLQRLRPRGFLHRRPRILTTFNWKMTNRTRLTETGAADAWNWL